MTRHSFVAISFGLVLAIFSAANAADPPAKTADPAKPLIEVNNVTIQPVAAPKQALKHHLLPTFLEGTPGDAMPLYVKALVRHMEAWKGLQYESLNGKENSASDLNNFEKWLGTPLDKLPRERVRKLVDSFSGTVKSQLELAVRREHCNWDSPLRQGHFYEVLLPETQEFRNVARVIALRARLQIAEGKYDDAIASLQTGYGMARQLAEQPFLVSNLVATVVTIMMNDQLLTLCQQPDVPSLYWSIAELPSPWIDRGKSIAAEYDGLYLQWPELQAVRHAQYTSDQWNLVLRKTITEMVRFEGDMIRTEAQAKEQTAKIDKMIANALDGLPRAKAAMLAAGYTQKQLDAMAPAQIVMLYSLDTHDAIRDEMYKWWRLPYPQAADGLATTQREIRTAMKKEIVPIATDLLPAVATAFHAFARADRQFAAIRCIEALRLYAGGHDGRLPASLDEIKEVPIPLNPMTGKPFPYRLEGKTAVLDADGSLTNVPRPQYRVVVAK
jgi:hypothetical protein